MAKKDPKKFRERFKRWQEGESYWKMREEAEERTADPNEQYDYVGYLNKYGSIDPVPSLETPYKPDYKGNGHYTDEFKLPGHPTFSDESIYNNEKTPGGHWKGDVFQHSDWTIQHPDYTRKYLDFADPGVKATYGGGTVLPELKVKGNTPNYLRRPKSNIQRPKFDEGKDDFDYNKFLLEQGDRIYLKKDFEPGSFYSNSPKSLNQRYLDHLYDENDKKVHLENFVISDRKNSSYGYVLPELVVEKVAPLKLNTYYPGNPLYFVGHSKLKSIGYDGFLVDTMSDDEGYNFVTNNCSDDTGRVLEAAFGENINPWFFTTPGDVRDFAIKHGGEKTYDRLGWELIIIPVTSEQKKAAKQEVIRMLKLYPNRDEYSLGTNEEIQYYNGGKNSDNQESVRESTNVVRPDNIWMRYDDSELLEQLDKQIQAEQALVYSGLRFTPYIKYATDVADFIGVSPDLDGAGDFTDLSQIVGLGLNVGAGHLAKKAELDAAKGGRTRIIGRRNPRTVFITPTQLLKEANAYRTFQKFNPFVKIGLVGDIKQGIKNVNNYIDTTKKTNLTEDKFYRIYSPKIQYKKPNLSYLDLSRIYLK